MLELSESAIRTIIQQETAHIAERLDDVESTLNIKMDAMLTKMDSFIGANNTEREERMIADEQLNRRIGRIEDKVGLPQ